MIELELVAGALMGLLGAGAYIAFWRLYEKPKEAVRHLILGVVAGFIYTIARLEHGLPDLILTFVVGWWAPDFLSGIAEFARRKKDQATQPAAPAPRRT